MKEEKQNRDTVRYLVADERDSQFGMVVNTVGRQCISPYQNYPPIDMHPNDYLFRFDQGRILKEYQLLYIISGKGTLQIDGVGEFNVERSEERRVGKE